MKKQTKNYRKAVSFVVFKKKDNKIKYLILKRKLHWKGLEFPKGGIEKGESELDAVKREIKEETRLKPVKIINHHKKGRYLYDKKTKKERGFIGQTYSLYSAEVCDGKVNIDKKENSGFKWLEFKKALKLLSWKDQRDCLKIVNAKLSEFSMSGEPRIRRQNQKQLLSSATICPKTSVNY
ncbi:MAG: NUDIX domain-containing protein [Nanoarchaeota archaeon]